MFDLRWECLLTAEVVESRSKGNTAKFSVRLHLSAAPRNQDALTIVIDIFTLNVSNYEIFYRVELSVSPPSFPKAAE